MSNTSYLDALRKSQLSNQSGYVVLFLDDLLCADGKVVFRNPSLAKRVATQCISENYYADESLKSRFSKPGDLRSHLEEIGLLKICKVDDVEFDATEE